MNILLILLGCHISYLLNDRIQTAVNFASDITIKTNGTANIDWFLSGGIKNPNEDRVTEEEKMAKEIRKYEGPGWNYIYDTIATNTAENFIMANRVLDTPNIYSDVYIVTSDFHHNRAALIANKIIGKEVKWILGNAELHDSRYWEKIHIRNVDNDVKNAFTKYVKIE
jgi:uncharacterized SAM-binding protein YcdF (DUF218 family)